MKKWILLTLSLLFSTTYALENKEDIQLFLQNPTYVDFLNASKSFANYRDEKLVNSVGIIFTMLALEKHPDFTLKLVKDFPKLSENQKVLLYTGLAGAGYGKETQLIQTQYQYKHPYKIDLKAPQISQLQLLKQLTTAQDLDQQLRIINYLWAAFFATGNEIYLDKLVAYVSANKANLSLNWKATLSVKETLQQAALLSVVWSIKSNACKVPAVKEKILSLGKKYHLEELVKMVNEASCKP